MAYPDEYRDKLSQFKIGGPSKPFIDKNLQLELPAWEMEQVRSSRYHSPIYSHYKGSSPSVHTIEPINEIELYQAMSEAKHSYQAWKQMKKKLKRECAKALKG